MWFQAEGALLEVIVRLTQIRWQEHAGVLVLDKSSLHTDEIIAAGVCAAAITGIDAFVRLVKF